MIDGVDVRHIPEPELRRLVGIALQESVLFSNTIRANLILGKPDATEEEIVEAARIAQADDFIRRFPEGYDTVVGQRGVNLSGGQKQRLAIARALLPKPVILILDDSTSAVDVATEARIQAGLATAASRQTRIVVAQRVSSVVNADRILVLDDGAIVGDGTHAELYVSCPVYREIHESQTENGVLVHGGE
jgi:ATP-binding cassette subfamily B protein